MANRATPPPPGNLSLGRRYVLCSRIGEGGMAGVYRCYDRQLRLRRAVKVLLPEYARKNSVRERFEREAHTMAQLEHPNLVRVYDVGQVAGLPFLVMELVDGGTLAHWTRRHGPMAPRLAVEVTLQVVRGLSAVHAHGVIHRDVKPKNVLVSSNGICKLTDFGIAQVEPDGRTKPGAVLGTLEYMAPEQRIDAKAVDVRADLYGVGATLWHLLRAEDRADLFLIESDRALLDTVPEALRPVLLRCLAYDRERRFSSADALAAALGQALEGMAPDPPGAPDLGSALSEQDIELDGDLGELESLLEQAAGRGRPLPYYMPDSDLPRGADGEEAIPEWVDRTIQTSGPETEVVIEAPGVRSAVLDATPGPVKVLLALPTPSGAPHAPVRAEAPRPPDPPSVDRSAEPSEDAGSEPIRIVRLLVPLLGILGVLILIGAGAFGGAVSALTEGEETTAETRLRLYHVLEEERAIVDELEVAGAEGDRLERSYASFAHQPEGPERIAAATRFVELVEAEGRVRVDPESSKVYEVQLLRRLGRIHTAHQGYQEARERWREAARRPLGRLALDLGLGLGAPE